MANWFNNLQKYLNDRVYGDNLRHIRHNIRHFLDYTLNKSEHVAKEKARSLDNDIVLSINQQADFIINNYHLDKVCKDRLSTILRGNNFKRVQEYLDICHEIDDKFSFEQFERLYVFDELLRGYLFQGLASIEMAFKATFFQSMSEIHGNLWLHDHKIYFQPYEVAPIIDRVLYNNSDVLGIEEMDEFYAVPAWKTVNMFSFGDASKIFTYLNHRKPKKYHQMPRDEKEILHKNQDVTALVKQHLFPNLGLYTDDIVYDLVGLRNHVFHHEMVLQMQIKNQLYLLPKKDSNEVVRDKIIVYIYYIAYALETIDQNNPFLPNINRLIDEYRSFGYTLDISKYLGLDQVKHKHWRNHLPMQSSDT